MWISAFRALAALTALLWTSTSAHASDSIFSFSAESFEYDRADTGFIDYTDTFEGEGVAPWVVSSGTVEVADGLMTLRNPGTHISFIFPGSLPPGARTLRSDMSQAQLWPTDTPPSDENGNFSVSVVFDQFSIPQNQFVVLAIALGNVGEGFAIGVSNHNARGAAIVGGSSGPVVGFSHNLNHAGAKENLYFIDFFETCARRPQDILCRYRPPSWS